MMYDQLSTDYDRFVHWTARLAAELPFLEDQLGAPGEQRPLYILDTACGTGMHAIALAKKGYRTAGADLSTGMVEKARLNAAAAGVAAPFEAAGFGDLARAFRQASFDALLCLGNSLPHVLAPLALQQALGDFAACLRPGGLLLVQNRNFDAVLSRRVRWMDPQSYLEGDREWLFLRFNDFLDQGLLDFNMLVLTRQGNGPWSQQATSTRLWPMRQEELAQALSKAGFEHLTWFGDMAGSPFQPESSGNLIVSARRSA